MEKKIPGISILLALLIPCMNGQDLPPANQADEVPADTTVLEEVSISLMPFREQYLEATGAVFTMRGEEISTGFGITSAGLYNKTPGVYMASGALNTHRVVIRGVGSRTPYNSNRIRAYLDDIPLTSGDGISTLEDQDLLAIGSMEVVKGPSSALYGSGLGGVIRLNSPYPEFNGWGTRLQAEAGSFGSQRYALTGSYKQGSVAFTGGYSRTSTDGFRENSTYLRNSAFLHGRMFGKKHRLALTLSLVDLYAEIPSSLNEEDFLNNPDLAGGSWGSVGGYEDYKKVLGGLKLESELGSNLHNTFILSGGFSDPYERRPFNILDEQSANMGFREFLEYRQKKLSLGIGLEYYHENFNWKTFETLTEGQGILLSHHKEQRNYLNLFTYGQWRPSPRVLVDAGLNLNLLSYSLDTQYRVDSTDQSGSYSYQPVLSPRVGISIRHQKRVWTYASAGHGFSAPSLEETLLPEGMVNTSLRPETGWNLDLGNRGKLWDDRVNYDLSLYSIFLDDLLVTERLAEDVFTGINAGSAWNRGLEVLLKSRLFPGVPRHRTHMDLQVSYQLSKNTFRDFVDDGTDYSGNELPGIPRQVLNTTLQGHLGEFSLEFQYIFTGRQWMDDANSLEYESYQLGHLQLSWTHGFEASPFQLKLYGGVRNLGDRHYASMILINAPSFGGRNPRYYYPGSPRLFYLGLQLAIHPKRGKEEH
jgi:iron complex outermembrane receptor protein